MGKHPILSRAVVFILGVGGYSYYYWYILIFDWCRKRPGFPHKFNGPESTLYDCIVNQLNEGTFWTIVAVLLVIAGIAFLMLRVRTKTAAKFYGAFYALFFLYFLLVLLTPQG
ncbi:hypothetical protein COU76_05015 [Candidatus Peregrinibacteria bacterium CG10_big_fil_rev_8_21_14_0_10_49_10]|nr:MAG: hypothetical protein COU76_05015 [Candidatus Peregrinibacteria bacterium CG10_big_fil_rev_8_21_14_0_10_49_10]